METPINILLQQFREKRDALDVAEQAAKAARAEVHALETQILDTLEALDIESVAAEGLNVKRVEKWRAKYDPARWSEIVSWAVANGFDYLVQRRLNDAKIMELIDQGIRLPDGLSVECYSDLSFRRS